MAVYNNKDKQTWINNINDAMPSGFLWNKVGAKEGGINLLLNCFADIFARKDEEYATTFNSIKLSPDSQFLDEYWDMFDISTYIKEKPANKTKMYRIIKAFATASQGISTAKQIKDFISEAFDLNIDIYISDIKTSEYNNKFTCKFPFKFASFSPTDNTVVVKLPTSNDRNDENALVTSGMPFKLINRDNYTDAIKMLLDLLIDVDLKIIYI